MRSTYPPSTAGRTSFSLQLQACLLNNLFLQRQRKKRFFSPCWLLQILVSCTKGILNDSLETTNQILTRVLPPAFHSRLAYLSGPSFAAEVAAGQPSAVTIAAEDGQVALRVQKLLSTPRFRCYSSRDVAGTGPSDSSLCMFTCRLWLLCFPRLRCCSSRDVAGAPLLCGLCSCAGRLWLLSLLGGAAALAVWQMLASPLAACLLTSRPMRCAGRGAHLEGFSCPAREHASHTPYTPLASAGLGHLAWPLTACLVPAICACQQTAASSIWAEPLVPAGSQLARHVATASVPDHL